MTAATRPFVSAALIVRDEAAVLGPCLQSLRSFADEIVVVDTGSRDASRDIAASHGARVVDFAWRDDFAAARNHALDCATGAWILYIDADERLHDIDPPALRRQLDDPDLIACTVRFYPRTGFTAYPEHRLFRRDDRIRFIGAIHETVQPAIRSLVAAGEGLIGATGLAIHHIGYDGDQSHKLDRNESLLRKQIAADPGRAYLWWHLGTVERDRGHPAEAEAAWRQGVALARQRAAPDPKDSLCFIELVKCQLAQSEDAQALLAEAELAYPGNWMLLWLKAKALVATDRDAEALPIFERLAHIDADTLIAPVAYDRQLFGRSAWAEMGHCAFRLGRVQDSARYYRLAQSGATDTAPPYRNAS